MEILAPAGNWNQAIAAIDAGCDALYGGLKHWGARNRAENFTIDEYNKMISICKEHKVKFYLTLNTLLKDYELDEIFEVFLSGEISSPDAIIAADIGLITKFRSAFPNIDIHASTQFGAATLADIKYLEMLGVSRVVLARELSLHEIELICDNTNIEIEVFVYGSQCVSFSGQCLWGGLLNKASGNRGRCIGMCRDLYEISNGRIGQFMYPQDINAINLLNRLSSIGVTSAKIEGRLRSVDEIRNVVTLFKAYNNETVSDEYVGFLNEFAPAKQMFNAVNPRTKYSLHPFDYLTSNDLILESYPNSNESYYSFFTSDSEDSCDKKFIKSIFTQHLQVEVHNISFKAIIENDVLVKLDFINTFGERKMFLLNQVASDKLSSEELYHLIKKSIQHNIYEFTTNLPSKKEISLNILEVMEILNRINVLCGIDLKSLKFSGKDVSHKNIILETDDISKIEEYSKIGITSFIYRIERLTDLIHAVKLVEIIPNIVFKLPLLDFGDNLNKIMSVITSQKVMITKLSQLYYLHKYQYANIIADYTLNLWNDTAIKYVASFGVSAFVFNPELSYDYNLNLSVKTNIKGLTISFGKIPIGYTRGCFKEVINCNKNCKESINFRNISKGYSVDVVCNNDFGYRKIVPEKPFACKNPISAEVQQIYIDNIPDQESLVNAYQIYDRSVK